MLNLFVLLAISWTVQGWWLQPAQPAQQLQPAAKIQQLQPARGDYQGSAPDLQPALDYKLYNLPASDFNIEVR